MNTITTPTMKSIAVASPNLISLKSKHSPKLPNFISLPQPKFRHLRLCCNPNPPPSPSPSLLAAFVAAIHALKKAGTDSLQEVGNFSMQKIDHFKKDPALMIGLSMQLLEALLPEKEAALVKILRLFLHVGILTSFAKGKVQPYWKLKAPEPPKALPAGKSPKIIDVEPSPIAPEQAVIGTLPFEVEPSSEGSKFVVTVTQLA